MCFVCDRQTNVNRHLSCFYLLRTTLLWLWCANISLSSCFQFSCVFTQKWNHWAIGYFWVSFFDGLCHTVFHSSCLTLHCPQQCTSIPVSPHAHQYWLFHFLFFIVVIQMAWSNVSLWFWFAFPWWLWCWASTHVLIGYLNIFFGETSIQVFCLFFYFSVVEF
jgi:hypothetical protein